MAIHHALDPTNARRKSARCVLWPVTTRLIGRVATTHLPINVAWHVSPGPLQGCAVSSVMNISIWMQKVSFVFTLPWQPIGDLDMFSWLVFDGSPCPNMECMALLACHLLQIVQRDINYMRML